ncbi:MAG: hypothetical protein AB1896_16020 [Thermodesulfobacteriota bacterium]
MDNEKTKCPWCGEEMMMDQEIIKREHGRIRERRCGNCGRILAAYLVEEGDSLMPTVRKYSN